ncbi:hypothetical protein ACFY8Z_36555 [Streptomyces microflavus]|uniref:hypothetical protein n=1 Tax=Streptomyces microflavus TaxID=1919 RepID=UPI0036E3F3D0
MKPIPDEADDIVRAFVEQIRDLVQDTVRDRPVSDLARYGPLARSTFMHALSGQRMPTRQTMDGIIDSIAQYKDLSTEEHLALRDRWRGELDAVTRLERGESHLYINGSGKTQSVIFGLMAGDQQVTSIINGVPAILDADTARVIADRAEAERSAGEEPTTALGVTAAAEALERALDRLEEASRDVAQARETLRREQDRANLAGEKQHPMDKYSRWLAPEIIDVLAKNGLSEINGIAVQMGKPAAFVYQCLTGLLVPEGIVEVQRSPGRAERYILTEKGLRAATVERRDESGASNVRATVVE